MASGDITLFKLLRNKVNRERKRCRKLYYQKRFAIYVTLNPKIGGLHQDLCQETDETLCNKINNSFINVMKNYIPLSEDIAVSVNANETPITVTESAVARKLGEVKTSRSPIIF